MDETGLIYGSTFEQRVFVPDKKIRDLLLKFTDPKLDRFGVDRSGLEETQYEDLKRLVQRSSVLRVRSISFMLSQPRVMHGIYRPQPRYRTLLFSLGTPAPAATLLRPQFWEDIEAVVSTREVTVGLVKVSIVSVHTSLHC